MTFLQLESCKLCKYLNYGWSKLFIILVLMENNKSLMFIVLFFLIASIFNPSFWIAFWLRLKSMRVFLDSLIFCCIHY